jgi:hypothetical protein
MAGERTTSPHPVQQFACHATTIALSTWWCYPTEQCTESGGISCSRQQNIQYSSTSRCQVERQVSAALHKIKQPVRKSFFFWIVFFLRDRRCRMVSKPMAGVRIIGGVWPRRSPHGTQHTRKSNTTRMSQLIRNACGGSLCIDFKMLWRIP